MAISHMENGGGRGDAEVTGYRFDDVEVDARRHRVLRGGVELALEPKAYSVLVELLRHAGDVVARDALLDAVWGHRHVTPAVLSRIVAILRRELGDDADHSRLIRTVHGVGYEFIGTVRDVGEAAPSSPAAASTRIRPPLRRFASILLVLAAAALLALAWWLRPGSGVAPAVASSRGVAVLPLVNASGAAEQQFFSDGVSESLIATLAQFDGLKVIGRSSSFRFRDGKEDARAIGAKLGVDHLIEGSVQRVGDDVRVGVELVRTADGSTVWTQRFDRPYKDLFALQDEIALAVAGALQVKLLHAMPGAIDAGRPASGNLDAYNAFLRGTYYMSSGKDWPKAIEQYAQATRLDPRYAQAWSWLGFARTQHARFALDGDAARAAYAQAREDIDTALKLAPDFGLAHSSSANLLNTADYDWNGALAEFRIALPLVPENDPSHGAVSRLLSTLGKIDEAIRERRKYIDGDPLAGFAHVYLAQLQTSLGQLDEAEASLRKALQVEPEDAGWYAGERSYLAVLRGDAETARTEAMGEPPGHWRDRALTLALQVGDDRAAADAALQRLIETDGRAKGGAYVIAQVYALRGDADHAFEWLQRDWDRRDAGVYDVLRNPLLLRFRGDARFAAYCETAGLPPPSASEALDFDRIRAMRIAKR